jgi:hypothetical protein
MPKGRSQQGINTQSSKGFFSLQIHQLFSSSGGSGGLIMLVL